MSKLSKEDRKEILENMPRRRRNRGEGLYKPPKKVLFKPASSWEELGLMAFAIYYDLTMEEAVTMINNPNSTLDFMIEEMKQSLRSDENFKVRKKKIEEEGEEWTRLDFLDFRK